jgi:hypothetical protein
MQLRAVARRQEMANHRYQLLDGSQEFHDTGPFPSLASVLAGETWALLRRNGKQWRPFGL